MRAEAADSLRSPRVLVDAMVTEMDAARTRRPPGARRGLAAPRRLGLLAARAGAFLVHLRATASRWPAAACKRDERRRRRDQAHVRGARRRGGRGSGGGCWRSSRRRRASSATRGSGSTRAAASRTRRRCTSAPATTRSRTTTATRVGLVLGREDPAVTGVRPHAASAPRWRAAWSCWRRWRSCSRSAPRGRWRDAVIGAARRGGAAGGRSSWSVGPLLLARLAAGAAEDRDRHRAAAVRARVAAQGRPAAGRPARALVARSHEYLEEREALRGADAAARRAAGLAGADRRRARACCWRASRWC